MTIRSLVSGFNRFCPMWVWVFFCINKHTLYTELHVPIVSEFTRVECSVVLYQWKMHWHSNYNKTHFTKLLLFICIQNFHNVPSLLHDPCHCIVYRTFNNISISFIYRYIPVTSQIYLCQTPEIRCSWYLVNWQGMFFATHACHITWCKQNNMALVMDCIA